MDFADFALHLFLMEEGAEERKVDIHRQRSEL